MINVGLHPVFSFGLGVVLLGCALWMLSDRISTRIRKSRYWVVGWLGYLMTLSLAAKLMLPLYAQAGIDDEHAVPVLFVVVIVVTALALFWNLYQFKKPTRKNNATISR